MDGIDGSGEAEAAAPRLARTPKEGERILAPTRRPDGTLRKPIRIRAGYVPQDEVAIYQSKGARMKKSAEAELPPGYYPVPDEKPKTKSAKRNERKKEKKLQAALTASDCKGKSLDAGGGQDVENQRDSSFDPEAQRSEHLESVTSELNKLSVSAMHSVVATELSESSNPDPSESLNPDPSESSNPDPLPFIILDKKIRALKKKIRLAEAQEKGAEQNMKPEHLEKLAKVAAWRDELKILEDKKAAAAAASSCSSLQL